MAKERILKLIEILKTKSDESHPLTLSEISEALYSEGIEAERKALYDDFKVLAENGYDVVKVRMGYSSGYYLVNSDFDVAELKILLDAVEAARFISAKKTDSLAEKIARKAGPYKGELLKRGVVCFNAVKHSNDKVFYSVDTLLDGISLKKKVSFKYFDFDINGKKVYRKGGAKYILNPVALVISEDNYYLVAYSDNHDELSSYRIDKTEDVTVTDEDIKPSECVKSFNYNKHPRQSFSMFFGESEKVTLRCDNSMSTIIVDRFGEKVKMTACADGKFDVTVNVQISPTFFAWCATFKNRLKIVSPAAVIEQFKEMLSDILKQY